MQESAEQVASTHGASVILAEVSQPAGRVWWLQLERPVGTVAVVMLDVDPQDLLEVAAPDDQQPVQALGTDGAHPAFRVGIRRGRRTGVTSTSPPSEQNTSSKLRQNLASWSRSTKRTCRPRSPSTSSRFRACWVTQRPFGWAVTPARWTRRVQLNEEQHIQPPRRHGLDGEEVARDDPRSLLARERPPGRGGPPRHRVQAMAAKRRADRSRGHVHVEPQELALDPLVTPGWVLPRQSNDQLLGLLVQRWPARLAVRVGPTAGHQAPVPAQQGLGLHKEARPAGSRQHPADRGQRPVSGLQPGT